MPTPLPWPDAYFNNGDSKVEDVTATIAAAAGETTITIAAADVPAGAQSLTVELTAPMPTTPCISTHPGWNIPGPRWRK